jgi:Protein of unknown function (DUF3467)
MNTQDPASLPPHVVQLEGEVTFTEALEMVANYANIASVHLSAEECALTFGVRGIASPNTAKTVAIIYMSLPHAKRLVAALGNSIKIYEDNFGLIITDAIEKLSDEARARIVVQRRAQ